MASNIETALGTQMKFSPNPQGVYEKRLSSLPMIASQAGNEESQLAKALGLLGSTVYTEGQSNLERKQKVGIADAERAAAAMTEEDYHNRTAVQILSQYGKYNTSENPYAIALIEKMRGKYFNAQFNQEYDLFAKEDGGFKKTAGEEGARYEEFMKKKYQEVAPVTINQDAFNSGYFDNLMVQKIQKMHEQITWQSHEMDVQRIAGITAALSEITANYQNLTSEQKTKFFNDQMVKLGMSGGYGEEAIEQTKQMLQDYATRTGDYEWIEDLKKNGILGVNLKGEQMKVSDFINTNDYVRTAEMTRTHKWTQLEQDTFTKLSQMSVPELNQWFTSTEKTNNHLYQEMIGYRPDLVQSRIKQEEKKAIHATNTSMRSGVQKAAFNLVNRHMSLWINGINTDVKGNPIASSLSDFEPLKYQEMDANGNPVDKEYKITQQDVNVAISNQLLYINNKQDWTPEQKAEAALKLLEWGVAKDYVNAFKNTVRSELSVLTNDGLKRDSNGGPILSQNISSALVMLRTNHDRAGAVFGDDNTRELETLELLTQGTGDLEKGVSLYAQARSNRQDPQMRQQVSGEIGAKLNFGSAKNFGQFETIDGQKVDADYTLASNADFLRRARIVAENLRYAGYASDDAVNTAMDYVRQNTYIYRDAVVPRTLFANFNVEDKNTLGRKVLDDCVYIYANEKGVSPAVVSVDYDIDSKTFKVRSGNLEPYVWSAQQLTDYGNNKAYEDTVRGQQMQHNISLDEVNTTQSNNAPSVGLGIAGWNSYPGYYDQTRGDRP